MTDLASVEGRSYGPFAFTVDRARIAAFVAATGDDADRWVDVAPPSFAATTLFLPAPAFFADPDVAPYTGSVIHADQSFTWHRPWKSGEYEVVGTVGRIRDRRGVAFVGFTMSVTSGGQKVLDAASTFLMSSDAPPAGGAEARPEPPSGESGPNDSLAPVADLVAGDDLPALTRSASRADLVRYAAASNDFNPIHWDHDSAVQAGLPGVVCHGLLLASWMFQSAARLSKDDRPLADAKVRFKAPVLAAAACEVTGEVGDSGVSLVLSAGGIECVTGRAAVTP